MTVRLLAVSTAANTDAALHEAVRRAQGEVELVLHLGGGDADFKASAVSRMNLRRGRRGHLTEGTRWSGLAHGLFMQPDYDAQVDDFIDHLSEIQIINPLHNLSGRCQLNLFFMSFYCE